MDRIRTSLVYAWRALAALAALTLGLSAARCAGPQLRYAYPETGAPVVEVLADLTPQDDGRIVGQLRTLLGTADLSCELLAPDRPPARPLDSYAHTGASGPIGWGYD